MRDLWKAFKQVLQEKVSTPEAELRYNNEGQRKSRNRLPRTELMLGVSGSRLDSVVGTTLFNRFAGATARAPFERRLSFERYHDCELYTCPGLTDEYFNGLQYREIIVEVEETSVDPNFAPVLNWIARTQAQMKWIIMYDDQLADVGQWVGKRAAVVVSALRDAGMIERAGTEYLVTVGPMKWQPNCGRWQALMFTYEGILRGPENVERLA